MCGILCVGLYVWDSMCLPQDVVLGSWYLVLLQEKRESARAAKTRSICLC
jgi:hypothetical protein